MANRRGLLLTGETFEFRLMSVIKGIFPDAVVLHDLHLESVYLGKETQIDVVVVSSSGIFVLEAKNWKFWIKGDYDDFEWSGLTAERKIITVFNPYHQNFIHIRALRNAIRQKGVNPVEFKNLIVLPDGTEIESNCTEVVNLSKLPTVMRSLAVSNSVDKDKYVELIRSVT